MLQSANLATATLSELAGIIRADWRKVYFGAVPYLDALSTLRDIGDAYGCDDGRSVVLYFLANANGWRGDVARAVKLELRRRAGV